MVFTPILIVTFLNAFGCVFHVQFPGALLFVVCYLALFLLGFCSSYDPFYFYFVSTTSNFLRSRIIFANFSTLFIHSFVNKIALQHVSLFPTIVEA